MSKPDDDNLKPWLDILAEVRASAGGGVPSDHDLAQALRDEYERGKRHGQDDCKLIASNNREQGREIDRLKREASEVKLRAAKLKNALSFYADARRYRGPNTSPIQNDPFAPPDFPYRWDVTRDDGAIARAAIDTANGG